MFYMFVLNLSVFFFFCPHHPRNELTLNKQHFWRI